MLLTKWQIDVDGVLNASRAGWHRAPHSTFGYANGQRYRIRYEPKLIDRIREFNRREFGTAEWSSTWCEWESELRRMFGIELGTAFGPRPPHLTYDEQKIQAARDALDAGYRLIWTDDTVVPIALRLYPEFQAAIDLGRALLIAPNPARGLRPEDIDRIEMFADGALVAN